MYKKMKNDPDVTNDHSREEINEAIIEEFLKNKTLVMNTSWQNNQRFTEPYIKYALQIGERGMTIGISPTDHILATLKEKQIKTLIERYFNRLHCLFILVPDYSEKIRLHYHGIIVTEDTSQLLKIKRWTNKRLGRIQIEQIVHVTEYVKYMFKIYQQKIGLFKEFKESHVIHDNIHY